MSDDGDILSNATPSTVAMILCFGTVTFVGATMAARTFLLGDSRAILIASNFQRHNSISPVENSFVSIFVLLYHLMLLGMIMLVTYIIEHHPPFPHADRALFDEDYLGFLVLIMTFFAFMSVQRNDGKNPKTSLKIRQVQVGSRAGMSGDSDSERDGGLTVASELPSIATRRSVRSENSNRSSLNSRSGEVEDINSNDALRKSTFLDTLDEESRVPSKQFNARDMGTAANDLEDVRLLDEDESAPAQTQAKSARSRGRISGKSSTSTLPIKSAAVTSLADVLNIHQSLEWKGLLSAGFLLFQLTDAVTYNSDVNLIYNVSQVGASCFVFMTGFGHAMYFYTRNSYRVGRILQVLFRLNFTAFLLCATMSRPYILYYVCPLHTMAFAMTFAAMKANQVANYSKYGLRLKLLALAAFVYCLWDFDTGLFDALFSPFFTRAPLTEILPDGALWSWYYHSHMHHWISFVGIIYAINYPITTLLLEKMESLSDQMLALAKSTVAGSLLIALALWTYGPFSTAKLAFDSTHSYFAFLPVLSYVYFRNMTPFLREHHLRMLKTLGKFSLETYLFHHYFFLTNDGLSALTLVPGYPKCNAIVSLILLLAVASTVNNLTAILCGMMFPSDDDKKCIRSLMMLGTCGLGFYVLAYSLDSMELSGANVVTIVILLLGMIAYQIIMAVTWTEYKNVGRQLSVETPQEEETPVLKASPPIIGTMVVLVLGITWHILSMAAASGGNGPLLRSCEAFVNDGIWAPVSSCNEFQRGYHSRYLSVGGCYGACEEGASMHWGWRQTRASLKCRFRPRAAQELQQKLAHRKIIFVGDLTIRSLYHALCRRLGDVNSGRFDSTMANHADVSKAIGSIRLEYKWAPLAFDQVSKLRDVRTKESAGQKQADLIVVGGGTLDRLHVWATDEDQASHKVSVQKLSKELEFATAPTIWCTPTTVNTAALGTDEKRSQMNEMAISGIRQMYIDLDVEESADFVLDGPSYSRGRVSESYDGVLYPRNVYDAGIQIIANSLDWLLPQVDSMESPLEPSPPGTLCNPFLGLMMVGFSMIGLFFFDGYLGFSYLSSLLVRHDPSDRTARGVSHPRGHSSAIMPNDMYDDAFVSYHQRLKLPSINPGNGSSGSPFATQGLQKKTDLDQVQVRHSVQDVDILSLLENDSLLGGGRNPQSRSRRSVIR